MKKTLVIVSLFVASVAIGSGVGYASSNNDASILWSSSQDFASMQPSNSSSLAIEVNESVDGYIKAQSGWKYGSGTYIDIYGGLNKVSGTHQYVAIGTGTINGVQEPTWDSPVYTNSY